MNLKSNCNLLWTSCICNRSLLARVALGWTRIVSVCIFLLRGKTPRGDGGPGASEEGWCHAWGGNSRCAVMVDVSHSAHPALWAICPTRPAEVSPSAPSHTLWPLVTGGNALDMCQFLLPNVYASSQLLSCFLWRLLPWIQNLTNNCILKGVLNGGP